MLAGVFRLSTRPVLRSPLQRYTVLRALSTLPENERAVRSRRALFYGNFIKTQL
jgi:hypothetical protein